MHKNHENIVIYVVVIALLLLLAQEGRGQGITIKRMTEPLRTKTS